MPINAGSIREILLRHDPLAAWPAATPNRDGYEGAAERAGAGLRRMLGLGQVWTVVADALDLQHPGFYRAVRSENPELQRRLGLVARELWDRHGNLHPRLPSSHQAPTGPPPDAPAASVLIADPEVLENWLREMEAQLEAERDLPPSERAAAVAMGALLAEIVDAYFDAADGEREEVRLAFSRFRLCCYQLSRFAGRQHAGLSGPDPAGALRRALVAESLLDMQLDWRDELLLIQALKRSAEARGLPYAEMVELAAARSSPRTAHFLRNA